MSSLRNKVKPRRALRRIAERLRRGGEKIVFTNGCFDILHAGHVTYLEKAKHLGDILVVGLNSDSSVRRIKGRGRPVNPASDRLRVLAAVEAVDYVTLFSEDTPLNLIRELRPHILVKGADWEKEAIVGREEVESWGGRLKRIPLVPGRSTSKILKKMRSREAKRF